MSTPAERLLGRTLDGGWKVVELVPLSPKGTGGIFSVGYIVETHEGRKGFLKAMDFTRAIEKSDPVLAMNEVTEAFVFERTVLERCKKRRLDRVVLALTDGKTTVSGFGPLGVVPYLIFELADRDVRTYLDVSQKVDLAWTLRSLHNVAVGLKQLHGETIAHLDIKPSNVLVFHKGICKVSDLGRAAYSGHTSPHESAPWPGDKAYCPPEFLYGQREVEWNIKNIGTDAYLLGSMIVFYFTRTSMTALLFSHLDPAHHPSAWVRNYSDVLPYVRNAFASAIRSFASHVPESVRGDLANIVTELCEPDPKLRGTSAARNSGKIFMQTYVARLNLLAYRAESGLLKE
jgi:serine/threonine protein kinase